MMLNDIITKLAKHNLKRYMVFCVSVIFAVSMLGAFGVSLFSQTITGVLVAGGSTYMFALGMYAFTIVGMIVFLVYANSIYIKYKMEDTGIFLSLGLKRQTVLNMLNREFCMLFGISALIGLVLSVPIAFIFWTFLTLFLETAETAFAVGWSGLLAAVLFVMFMWGLLMFSNSKTVKKMDIIKILKISAENEEVKFANPTFGLIGLISIPVGVILFNVSESTDGLLGQISLLFLALSLAGLYLLTSEITAIGGFFKKHFQRIYLKNILFFNLVKQKGKQYTLALFVSTILIAVTIFGICFISTIFLEGYYQIMDDPYDYSLLVNFQQKGIDEATIRQLASDHEIDIQAFVELDILLIGREHQNNDGTGEWSGQYVTSESSYNLLIDSYVDVPENNCLVFDDMAGANTLNTIYGNQAIFYNPTTKEEFCFTVSEKIAGDNLLNRSGAITDLIILNDSDYELLKASVDNRYQLKYYLFNAPSTANTTDFHNALLETVVNASDGKILDNFFDSPVRELMIAEGKDVEADDYYIDYEGNELYTARWWDMYPFSEETSLSTQIETGAIYFLIMLFIVIIAFVSAVMVIGLKILGTIWQDEEIYQKAVFLGLKKKALKKLIAKQISLIYYYPTIFGCIIGVIMINQIVFASSSTHVGVVTLIAAILSLAVIIIQTVIYFLLKKKIFQRFSADTAI